MKYPETARKEGIQGRVYVTFVVETDGTITDIRVLRGIGGGCDEEAVRVVKTMPKWTSGVQREQAVRVQFNLPIRFVLDGKKTNASSDEKQIKLKKNNNGNVKMTYQIVDEMPQFDGGESALIDYLRANIKYPEAARKAKTEGKVYVTFLVEKDGSVKDIKLLRGIGNGCDEEAIRIVELMPKWIAGKQAGQEVDVQFNLPIIFKLK